MAAVLTLHDSSQHSAMLSLKKTLALQPSSSAASINMQSVSNGGVHPRDMLVADEATDYSRPTRPPPGSYSASADDATFTRNHTAGGSYYSTNIPAAMKSHANILSWGEGICLSWRMNAGMHDSAASCLGRDYVVALYSSHV